MDGGVAASTLQGSDSPLVARRGALADGILSFWQARCVSVVTADHSGLLRSGGPGAAPPSDQWRMWGRRFSCDPCGRMSGRGKGRPHPDGHTGRYAYEPSGNVARASRNVDDHAGAGPHSSARPRVAVRRGGFRVPHHGDVEDVGCRWGCARRSRQGRYRSLRPARLTMETRPMSQRLRDRRGISTTCRRSGRPWSEQRRVSWTTILPTAGQAEQHGTRGARPMTVRERTFGGWREEDGSVPVGAFRAACVRPSPGSPPTLRLPRGLTSAGTTRFQTCIRRCVADVVARERTRGFRVSLSRVGTRRSLASCRRVTVPAFPWRPPSNSVPPVDASAT